MGHLKRKAKNMKTYPVVLFFLVLFSTASVSLFGQECEIGFWGADNWVPSIRSTRCGGEMSEPNKFILTATSYYVPSGTLNPIDWKFYIKYYPFNSAGCGDCWISGCHEHDRITDASQNEKMLRSIGGIKLVGDVEYNNYLFVKEQGYVSSYIAKPEASGELYLLAKAGIPEAMRTSNFWLMNREWQVDIEEPQDYIFQVMNLPYHIEGLVLLPDGNEDYIKVCGDSLHTEGQNYYGRPQMINGLTQLAQDITDWYSLITTTTEDPNDGIQTSLSINDLSLMYGGIYDVDAGWDSCGRGHQLHRLGKSADINTTRCLVCVEGQSNCPAQIDGCGDNGYYEYYDEENNKISGYIKEKLVEYAAGRNFRSFHPSTRNNPNAQPCDDPLIHLEYSR